MQQVQHIDTWVQIFQLNCMLQSFHNKMWRENKKKVVSIEWIKLLRDYLRSWLYSLLCINH